MNTQVVLPDPIKFSGNWAEWSTFIESCYEIFRRDFMTPPQLHFQGRPVHKNESLDDGKEVIFWHLTTREHKQGGRDPDPDRAERINWIRFMIENYQSFKVWRYLESAERKAYRWYIWAESDDFLVILEEKKKFVKYKSELN